MIRRLDLAQRADSDWVRDTAQLVYAPLGDYGAIIPGWMSHPGVLTYLDVDETGARRGFILVGFYEPGDRRAALVADLLAIGVAPEHQRQGIGRSLLEFALELSTEAATHSQVSEIRLTVAATNRPALALFRGAGFEILDEHHGAYDGGQRAIRMVKRLAAAAPPSA
jgi:ribosomal protein S18 acetylase RimI-like enzyme